MSTNNSLERKGLFFSTLKTESSNRCIIIDDFLLGELRRWQAQQTENEKEFGDSYVYIYQEADGRIQRRSKGLSALPFLLVPLVCIKLNGDLVFRVTITRILREEGFNAHSFRHTHATQLIENGAAPKGVAGQLGHANTQITQNL